MSDMPAVLAASAALLAVTGLLYSNWYPGLQAVLSAQAPVNRAERGLRARRIRDSYRAKAAPLAAITIVQLVVFLPDVVRVGMRVVITVASLGVGAIDRYDSIQAAFLLTYCGVAFLGAHAIALVLSFRRTIAAWEGPSAVPGDSDDGN